MQSVFIDAARLQNQTLAEKLTMNPAKNLASEYNPIDTVETIFGSRSFELERRGLNEVVVEVQGKWNNMLLFFAWEENMII